ncbi:periplasmic nitrate reductase, NapE protein [Paracoccus sp. (in: a-proteobacteria)]|uniref:periplasmic nitrate reductase, NapE protein n=1 Tax=Paracoccus sp. TaxID=267 RepID=UPI002AFFD88D|nr:periplasmic nitrate reductase, NapE protein [Paracoccus sp. (in: a-proteobacteria)]
MINSAPVPNHPQHRKRDEIIAFLILAVVIWPILSVVIVGGFGFMVWMWQVIFGPPGPLH